MTVCCTHLKAKKGFEDVRLAQARHLLGVIEVPLPLPRSNLQDHHRHLNDHDGRPGGKMRAHNPRWRLQCWLGRTRLPAGKLVNVIDNDQEDYHEPACQSLPNNAN